jgi:hypothetical protein
VAILCFPYETSKRGDMLHCNTDVDTSALILLAKDVEYVEYGVIYPVIICFCSSVQKYRNMMEITNIVRPIICHNLMPNTDVICLGALYVMSGSRINVVLLKQMLYDAEEIIQNFFRNTYKEVTTWKMTLICMDNIEINIEDILC